MGPQGVKEVFCMWSVEQITHLKICFLLVSMKLYWSNMTTDSCYFQDIRGSKSVKKIKKIFLIQFWYILLQISNLLHANFRFDLFRTISEMKWIYTLYWLVNCQFQWMCCRRKLLSTCFWCCGRIILRHAFTCRFLFRHWQWVFNLCSCYYGKLPFLKYDLCFRECRYCCLQAK